MGIKLAPHILVTKETKKKSAAWLAKDTYQVVVVYEGLRMFAHFGNGNTDLQKFQASDLARELCEQLDVNDIRWE